MEKSLNRIDQAFVEKQTGLLNMYFTAGYPKLDDTLRIASALEQAGADIIELGIPYSDPIADGPTIQESSIAAIENGMNLKLLFEQLAHLRPKVSIPVILMGYLNPVLQFGIERFCQKCAEVGIDGVILPDLPMHEYQSVYKELFESHGVHNIFLITPQTSEQRIQIIDQQSRGFIYMVSSASITGSSQGINDIQTTYFQKINQMRLSTPKMIGFGISDKETFDTANKYAQGAIIGSAFIRQLTKDASDQAIHQFVHSIISE
ncbi:MAG: tryptophan synthase alpha chain [Cyclobacteriaceae bacterium]|jgi:tryptophan synthase alpha chain